MDYDARVFPCYFDMEYLVSCKDKRRVNLRMETTILEMMKDIENHQKYLHKYWYTLRHFVCSIHAVYRLMYKVLCIFGQKGMVSKLKFHHLLDGPRPIKLNLEIFKEISVFIQIQM